MITTPIDVFPSINCSPSRDGEGDTACPSYRICTRRRSRTIRLTIEANGTVVISKPRFVPEALAKRFLQANIQWVKREIENIRHLCEAIPYEGTKEEYRRLLPHATSEIEKMIERWNAFYGGRVQSISIRNQRSRWGSCSSSGRLTMNYRIIFLPEHLQKYIVTHELCHLFEMNHSSAFWALMERSIPEYREHRRELRAIPIFHQ